MLPVGEFVSQQRRSVNREVWKNTSITREVHRGLLDNMVIPAIVEKWPQHLNRTIRIQQDGTKAHIKDNDKWFQRSLDELRETCGVDAIV